MEANVPPEPAKTVKPGTQLQANGDCHTPSPFRETPPEPTSPEPSNTSSDPIKMSSQPVSIAALFSLPPWLLTTAPAADSKDTINNSDPKGPERCPLPTLDPKKQDEQNRMVHQAKFHRYMSELLVEVVYGYGRSPVLPFVECLDLYDDAGKRVPDYMERARKKVEEKIRLKAEREAEKEAKKAEAMRGKVQRNARLKHLPFRPSPQKGIHVSVNEVEDCSNESDNLKADAKGALNKEKAAGSSKDVAEDPTRPSTRLPHPQHYVSISEHNSYLRLANTVWQEMIPNLPEPALLKEEKKEEVQKPKRDLWKRKKKTSEQQGTVQDSEAPYRGPRRMRDLGTRQRPAKAEFEVGPPEDGMPVVNGPVSPVNQWRKEPLASESVYTPDPPPPERLPEECVEKLCDPIQSPSPDAPEPTGGDSIIDSGTGESNDQPSVADPFTNPGIGKVIEERFFDDFAPRWGLDSFTRTTGELVGFGARPDNSLLAITLLR